MLKKPETHSLLRRMTVFTGFLTGSSIALNPDKNPLAVANKIRLPLFQLVLKGNLLKTKVCY
ncbi:hypothetical protein CJ305_06110 [Leeuwenhoekiella nanhaiensis]|uniref:Uncharacterized protein n=1 Tax=Leeuwenhoekiella nanhaiensis TaxID=1655491 RepID=A0A2G1VUS8_9FLAO|nr:hypothetical protein CJ305_06110 [Leeuwenhoekiella nanhaiensis]